MNSDIKIALLVVSDRAFNGIYEDRCEDAINIFLGAHSLKVDLCKIVPDGIEPLRTTICEIADSGSFRLLLTAGGTGISNRDKTPEATAPIIDTIIPGIAEQMRRESVKITPNAILSRQVAGLRKDVMIVNLPGSPKGAVENLSSVFDAIVHGIDQIDGLPHNSKR